MGLRIRLFGATTVVVDGEERAVTAPRQRAVLARLAQEPGRPISADRLLADVWGDDLPGGGVRAVAFQVTKLRDLLEPGRDGPGRYLATDAVGYRLDVEPDAVDLGRFERLVVEARAARDDPDKAATLVDDALALWRGAPLGDIDEQPWVTAAVLDLEEHRLLADRTLIGARLAAGDHAGVVADLERLIREHPLEEGLVADLMRALRGSGRTADALRAYADLRRRLGDELGLDPSPELQALETELLVGAPIGIAATAPPQLPAAIDPPMPSGVVTFLFTDIEGSTIPWDRSPDAMSDALERHDALMRAAVADHDGVVFATMGDGFGVAFARATDAVAAAMDAQGRLGSNAWPADTTIRVRMGLHVGEAQERGGDYFGPTINLTARIMGAGHGGQVLASESVAALVGAAGVAAVGLGVHHLAGVGEPQPIVQLGERDRRAFPPLRTEHSPAPADVPAPPRLLERDGPLQVLDERIARAGTGQGSLVLLAGAAGTGKSSVITAAVHRAGDVTVLRGGCDPLTAARPLGPLREIALEPAADIGTAAELGGDPLDVYERFLVRLKAPPGPILTVIEDVHWADDLTLDLIRYLARRIGRSRAVVVCTYRDDEVAADERLRTALGAAAGLPDVTRLTLDPLSADAVRELVDDDEVDADELHRMTGGNPFFVTEVIASGESVPASVAEAVLARVQPLPPQARTAVEVASIAPRSIDFTTLRQLPGVDGDGIDGAVEAGILEADGVELRFRHDLARAAVEQSLLPGRRSSLHAALLAERSRAPVPDLAELAHHAVGTGDPAMIVEHVPAGAREAVGLGARREALALFGPAVEAADRLDADLATRLRVELAEQSFELGRREDGERAIEVALGRLRSGDDRELLVSALVVATMGASNGGEYERPTRLGREAIEVLEPDGPGPRLLDLHMAMSRLGVVYRDRALTRRHLEVARALDAELGGARALDIDQLAVFETFCFGDFDSAIAQLIELRAVTVTGADDDRLFRMDHWFGSGCGEFRRYRLAVPALERSIAMFDEREMTANADYEAGWLAKVYVELGDFAAAEELLLRRPARTGVAGVKHLTALGRLRVRRGDPGGLDALDHGLELVHAEFLQHVWPLQAGTAEYLWAEGRAGEIPDVIGDTYELALQLDSSWARGELGFWMWKAGAIDGPPAGAASPYAHHMDGRWREAAEEWEQIGAPFEHALALADGDGDAGGRAVLLLDDLGAAPAAARVRAELRAAGRRSVPRGPNAATRGNEFGLTTRQAEVFALMVEGLSNAEIADRLVVTKKTAEHHVSAVFAQLGVTTRSQAIARARW